MEDPEEKKLQLRSITLLLTLTQKSYAKALGALLISGLLLFYFFLSLALLHSIQHL